MINLHPLDLCETDDLTILCLFERGSEAPYQTLTLARFNLAWLETAEDCA